MMANGKEIEIMNTISGLLRRPLSLKMAVGYKNILWGLSLMLMAASYSIGNIPFRIVISVFALIMSIISLWTNFHKKEEESEMHQRHIGKACDLALNLTCVIILFAAFATTLLEKSFSMYQVLIFCAGVGGFLQGVFFNLFEKMEGDANGR
jgi:hypothetical protein